MDEQSIFLQALEKDTPQERAKWLDGICGRATPLRQRIDALLERHFQASCFLEKPLVEVEGTLDLSDLHHPDANHSVLKALQQVTGELSQVALREPLAIGIDPIVKPASAEVPDRKNDSRYQLQGEIAQGGMGAIIRARDTDLGRDLAIKVLLERHKDKPEVIQRFVEEAQIGGQLQHPGIAPLYELGQFSDGRPFFSMKLVKGQTLSALLAERNDPLQDRGKFLGIFEQICQTMAYAHSRGVIHRDLKPANIMVGAFGEVQVMDWGLAKVLSTGGVADERKERTNQQDSIIETLRSVGSDTPEGSGSQTRVGSVMGTPAYMSPEQALGETDRLDERSDVFALGAILCVMLTGDPPYVGDDTTQVFRQATRGKLDDCFARLDSCGADSALIDLAKHCLEVESNDRPRDADTLAEQVSSYLGSVETRLRETELERATQAARAEEERKRRRVSMALAVSVLLSFGVAGGGWMYLDKQNSLQEQRRVERKDAAVLAVNDSLREAEYHARLADAEDVGSEDAKVEIDKAVVLAGQAVKSAMQEDVDELLRSRAEHTLNKLTNIRDNTHEELEKANTKRTFLTKLESIRLSQAQQGKRVGSDSGDFDSDSVDQDYEKAFRAAGFDLLNLEIPDAVALIQDSSMREEIISSLDHWVRWIPITESEDQFVKHVKARDFAAASQSAWRLVRQAPKNSQSWLRLAPILILRKDTDEYGKLCKRMVQTFAAAEDVQTAERTCKACLLLPDAIDLMELPKSKLTVPLDEGTAPKWLQPWGWFARALLAYRSGETELAMQFVKKSQEHNPNEFAAALNLALSALVQHELGHAENSLSDFNEASLAVNRLLEKGYNPGNYHDLMISHILLLEASALLDRETPLESERYFADRSSATPIPLTRRDVLLNVANEADTNEWRKSVRDVLGNNYDIAELRQMLADDAEKLIASASLIAWLGAALRDEGELDTSIMVLRASQRHHPQDFWLNYELAASLRQNGDHAEAVEFARAALAVRPKNLEATVALAGALRNAGRNNDLHYMIQKLPRIPLVNDFQAPEMHIDALRSFCERFPADPRGHLKLSMALDGNADLDEKIRALKKAAQLNVEQLNPKDAKDIAWYPMQLGHNLKARGRVDDAAEAFRIAIQFNPPAVDWVNLRIYRLYARAERWADAATVHHQLFDPDKVLEWLVQATLLALSGDEASYREHCRRMVERFPAARGAGNAVVTCKACCLLPPDTIDLERLPLEPVARSLDQESFEAWLRPWGWQARALVAYRKGDAKRALKYIQQSENSDPSAPAHAFNLVVRAMTQWKLANVDEARFDVERASKAIDFLPVADSGPINHYDALMAQILLREVEAKLEGVE